MSNEKDNPREVKMILSPKNSQLALIAVFILTIVSIGVNIVLYKHVVSGEYENGHYSKSSLDSDESIGLSNRSKDAEEALKIAKNHIDKKDYDVGRIYLINAINHTPYDLKYLTELVDLYRNHFKTNLTVTQETKSIIELSLFQLKPSNIENALEYLAELDGAMDHLTRVSSNDNDSKIIDFDPEIEFTTLKNQAMQSVLDIPGDTNIYLIGLNNLLTKIETQSTFGKFDSIVAKIKAEIALYTTVYDILIIKEKANNYLDLLSKDEDYTSESAMARLLAAKSAMSLVSDYDLSNVPEDLLVKINHDIPNNIQSIEKKIQQQKSIQYYEKAKTILNESLPDNIGSSQSQINRIEKAIEDIAEFASNITDHDYIKNIQDIMRDIQQQMVVLKKKQYIEYQEWASRQISSTFYEIENIKLFTDDDATRIFNNSYLDAIDLRLVSPEVSNAYYKVFQKIVGELPAELAFNCNRKVMTAQKKSYEDF